MLDRLSLNVLQTDGKHKLTECYTLYMQIKYRPFRISFKNNMSDRNNNIDTISHSKSKIAGKRN